MIFYSYFYLDSQTQFTGYVKYIAIFISLIALLIVTGLYLRHRLDTKYRDLSIIFVLIVLLLVGIQYNQYQINKNYANDSSRMVTFLSSVRDSQHLANEDLKVNSKSLNNGMILAVKNKFYEVHFNSDFSAYTLSPINLVNPNIQLIDKEE